MENLEVAAVEVVTATEVSIRLVSVYNPPNRTLLTSRHPTVLVGDLKSNTTPGTADATTRKLGSYVNTPTTGTSQSTGL